MLDSCEKVIVGDLSAKLGVAFGTSGVRGLVKDLTPELCFAFARSFLKYVCSDAVEVAIGVDLRPSSPDIARAIVKAVEAHGAKVVYCGELPTPALAFFGIQNNIPSIMVTGSHIPFDRNGIKFYRPDGEISKADEMAIMSGEVELNVSLESPSLPEFDKRAFDNFSQRYKDLFSSAFLSGKRVGVYEHSSVARDIIKQLLSDFGAEVVSLERTDTFVPIDTEAVSDEDAEKGRAWSKEFNLDAIVSTDGDGDRPLISDENGEWLRGDIVGVLCSDYLGATHVAAPVNVNSVLELSKPERFCLRTKIGSPYVIAGMSELLETSDDAKVVGYEANGGFLVGSNLSFGDDGKTISSLPTRDSILPILIVLSMSAEQGKSISGLVKSYPNRFTFSDRIKEIPTAVSRQFIASLQESSDSQQDFLSSIYVNDSVYVVSMNLKDGLRMNLSNNDILHFRPSGNAPELRCYVETDVASKARNTVEAALKSVKEKLIG